LLDWKLKNPIFIFSKVNGDISIIPMRPAKLSDIDFNRSGELDPVMIKRPDLFLSASIDTRKAENN
jgi:hypothetical protein